MNRREQPSLGPTSTKTMGPTNGIDETHTKVQLNGSNELIHKIGIKHDGYDLPWRCAIMKAVDRNVSKPSDSVMDQFKT